MYSDNAGNLVNLICISWTPVNSDHKTWSQGGSVLADFTVIT